MSEPTRTELIKALEVLQSYCDVRECRECMFRQDGSTKIDFCRLTVDNPAYWDTMIYELKEEKNCGTCLNLQVWDGYCGLGFNEEAREHGVCERWESK